MKIDASKILRALLAKVYKMQDGEIDELLNSSEDNAQETATQTILDKDTARIATLKTPAKGQTFQDGYAKGKKESLTELEKTIKEKFEIESDATGLDLIDVIVTAKAPTGAKPKEITEDDIRKSPFYQQTVKDHKKALTEANSTWQAKVTELETGQKKAETFAVVGTKAWETVTGMNPILPKNPQVADNLKKAYLATFKDFDYETQADGKTILVMKDGKVHTDSHGNNVTLDDLAKTNAAGYFEFQQNNGGGSTSNADAGKGAAAGGAAAVVYPAGITKPTNLEQLSAIVNDDKIKLEDRQTVMNVWQTEQAAGTK